jgi:hypothetical protein
MGKQIISVRISDETAQAIDQARGSQPRSAWLLDLIAPALGEPVYTKSQPGKKRNTESETCPPHPKGRVLKGLCYRCGMPAS